MPLTKKRSISAKDLFKLKIATEIALSPDEKQVAYILERIDSTKNKYFSNLWLLNLETNRKTQFTHGDFNDSTPVWSPDGLEIAFISSRDKKTAIYLISASGGAEKKIIELDAAIDSMQWTPDGNELLFSLRYNDSHFIKDEKKKKEPPVYRHITKYFFRVDGDGFIPQDKFQVYRLNIENSKLTKITKGNRDNISPSISPDGKSIVYVSNRYKDPDLNDGRDDLFVVSINGGKERLIKTPAGPLHSPTISPNGKFVAYGGHDNPDDGWGVTNLHIWKVALNGKSKAKNLIPTFDRMTYDQSITDTSDFHGMTPIKWSVDGKRVYFLSSDTGVTNLFYAPASGGRPTRIYRGNCHLKTFSINGKTSKATVVYSDLSNPGDIYSFPTTYQAEKKVKKHSDFNKFLKSEIKLGKTKSVFFKSFDGTEIQGWMVYPPNFNPNKKYRSILQIHGGPKAQYAFSFMHEMQYLAAQNYVVFYTNPRGGAGRGELWAGSISKGWGDLDYKDCMAAADYMEDQEYIHPKKIGVTGGSYGGYMTNLLIGKTNRFKAAVTQRSVVDLLSFVGSSDIGYALFREFDGWPWTNRENYVNRSPITYFKNVKTPVLIIHSEQDLRCHIEQAEQMFVMLKKLGKKVEMVRFPEEPHGLSRHGRPDRRIARLEWIHKWFKKYLA